MHLTSSYHHDETKYYQIFSYYIDLCKEFYSYLSNINMCIVHDLIYIEKSYSK